MLQQFAFSKHLLINILENTHTLFPGIRRTIAIYTDPEENKLMVYEKRKESGQLSLLVPESLNFDFEKERTQTKSFSWISESKNIANSNSKPHQLELSNEYQNNVLLIRIPSLFDIRKDLIYFYLDEGISLFQLSLDKTALTTREKNLIGQLTFNCIQLYALQHQQDASLFHVFNASFQNTIENLNKNETELKSTRQNYMQSIISFCNYHLEKVSEKSAYTFRLSDKAIDKIGTYKDKFEMLENIITNAATIALNRSYGKKGSTIIIDGSDIVLYSYEPEMQDINIAETDNYSKTREILDRYEHAAAKVLKNNLPLTGKNVGGFCSTAISPAAITDAIKKHRNKILTLFDKNPNKWPIIRNRFKPIVNLISNNKGRGYKIAI